ncbi:MAG: peptide-methionine (S)-S-oxide reductase MsrA [Bacteriovoracaceae bacterium]|nr:peptide-methionine (S)-S-oxide reductase MsrA [Bacteriovoracaceae bacterium]
MTIQRNFLFLFFLVILGRDAHSASTATVAGGCFWCIEEALEKAKGVKEAVSGYAGGSKKNPTYKEVSSGSTSHLEAVQISFDEKVINFETLIRKFFMNIDPTDSGGQFVDRGSHYAPAIFYHNDEQKKTIEKVIVDLDKKKLFSSKINIQIRKYVGFYPAEDYHQDYYKKNPIRYKFYKFNSGRGQFVDSIWKGQNKK